MQTLVFVMDLAGSSSPGDAAVLSTAAAAFGGALPASCEAMWPGAPAWSPVPLPTVTDSHRWLFAPVPLVRGALLLRCIAPQAGSEPSA